MIYAYYSLAHNNINHNIWFWVKEEAQDPAIIIPS